MHKSKSEKQSNVPNHYLSPSASDVRFTVLQLDIVFSVTRSGAGIRGTVDVVDGVWGGTHTYTPTQRRRDGAVKHWDRET